MNAVLRKVALAVLVLPLGGCIDVDEVATVHLDGADASISVDDDLLYGDDKGVLARKELRDMLAGERHVSWGASELSDDEKKSWEKEMAEAKANPNLPPKDKK